MRKIIPANLERARIGGEDFYGAFDLMGPCGERLCIVASGADEDDLLSQGWEHVSVSTRRRCPNWREMCFVKDLFWTEEEWVVQYHPAKADYINNHPYVLHLFRHKTIEFPKPPPILVGVKGVGELSASEAQEIRNAAGLTSIPWSLHGETP